MVTMVTYVYTYVRFYECTVISYLLYFIFHHVIYKIIYSYGLINADYYVHIVIV